MALNGNHKILIEGIKALGLSLSDECQHQLLVYLDLIIKWNKAYNLTAIRDSADMVRLHLLDSLSIVAPFNQLLDHNTTENSSPQIIDVGTGAGLPGIVLAILHPDIQMALLDTNGKKCRFLNQVKIELSLKNITVIHHRVETYQPEQPFQVVLSRAFATLKDMTNNARHLLSEDGRFLAMKGRYPERELEELDLKFSFEKAYPLSIHGLDVARYLVEITAKNLS